MAKPELLNHPKFGRLLRALKVPPYVGVGILETLWQRCYATTDDVVESAADLAWAIGWDDADADRLAAALVDAGFLDPEAGGFRVHNLFRHAPLYVRRRLGQNRALLGVTTRTEPNRTQEQEEQDAPRPTHPVENLEPALPFDAADAPEATKTATTTTLRPRAPDPVNPRVLGRLAYELVEQSYEDDGEVAEALKCLAAQHRIPYDAPTIARALEQVEHARGVLWVEPHELEKRKRRA